MTQSTSENNLRLSGLGQAGKLRKWDILNKNEEKDQIVAKQISTGNGFCRNVGQDQGSTGNDPDSSTKTESGNDKPVWQAEAQRTKTSNEASSISNRFGTEIEVENEISRLKAELSQKNEEIRVALKNNEKRKSELVELEKKIKSYQGQLAMMEQKLKDYEQAFVSIGKACDENAKYESQVEELVNLFEGMRKQNQTLNGNYEEKCYQLNKLTEKYIKLKSKLKAGGPRDVSKDHQIKSVDKPKRTPSLLHRFHEPKQEEEERLKLIKNLGARIDSMEAAILRINKQNQSLFLQLEERDQMISKLNKQLEQRKQRKKSGSSHKLLIERPLRKQGSSSIDSKAEEQYQWHGSRTSTAKHKIETILRKLKYNILTQEVSYQDLIKFLADSKTKAEDLERTPYGLNPDQSTSLMQWVKQNKESDKRDIKQSGSSTQEDEKDGLISALSVKIGKFKSLSMKRHFTLKIQVYNAFLNREKEFHDQMNECIQMDCQEMETYLRSWGLNQSEIDVILKAYYDRTGNIEPINLSAFQQVINQWKSL